MRTYTQLVPLIILLQVSAYVEHLSKLTNVLSRRLCKIYSNNEYGSNNIMG